MAVCAVCMIAPAYGQPAAPEGTPATAAPVTAPAPLRGMSLRPHMTLLLPTRSPDFSRAAEAVRNGVLAARDVLMPDMEVVVADTDDSSEAVLAAYREAAAQSPVAIVGPLTRSAVQAIASAIDVLTPTVALNVIDAAPPHIVMFALQIEAEARQIARLALADLRVREPGRSPTALVVTSEAPLHKRAAQAFQAEFVNAGGAVVATVDINAERGAALQTRLAATSPALVFLAVDAALASAARPYARDLPVYGTSQLNARADRVRQIDLEGVRLVDMPWLVQREAPEVRRYARGEDLVRYSADLDRLYAMGIDAFRLALDLGAGRENIGFSGVTGALLVERQHVERRALPAVIRDGDAVPDGL